MAQIIEVIIDENGKISSTTKGFQGGACLKAQEGLVAGLREQGIEAEFEGRVLTAEAQACVKAQQKVQR